MLDPQLVGRDRALARLAAALAPPIAGTCAVLVEGPSGIGKSRLLRAALALADRSGATVLLAKPVQTEAGFAFAALADLLGPQLPVAEPRLPPALAAVLRAACDPNPANAPGDPRSSSAPGTPGSTGAAGAAEPRTVGLAVVAAIRVLVSLRPVVAVIDDVPWLDEASRDALAFAACRLADLPIRLVLSRRADGPGEPLPLGLADGLRPVPTERIWLEPLSVGSVGELLDVEMAFPFTGPVLRRIHDLSGGNPFYALELARTATRDPEAWRSLRDLDLPSSLRDVVGAHVAELPVDTRELLLTVALCARPTNELLNARVGSAASGALQPAIDAGVVSVEHGRVRFAHPLFATSLVAQAEPGLVRAEHAWLGRAAGEDAEARARHLALATDAPDEGVARALVGAAEHARGRGALSTAAALLDLAAARTPAGGADERPRLLAAAEAWLAAGDLPAAAARAERLLPGLRGTWRARTLVLLGLVAWYRDSSRYAVALMAQALPPARTDRALQGSIHFLLSVLCDYDVAAGRRHALRAVDLLEATGDRAHFAAALLQAFYLSVLRGMRPPQRLLARGLAIEPEGGPVDRLTSPGMWSAAIGRLDEARARFRELLEIDHLHGVHANSANLLTRLAEVDLWADDWPSAGRLADEALEAARGQGAEDDPMARRIRALVDAHEGRLDAAEEVARHGLEESERSGSGTLAAAWLQVLSVVAAARGDLPGVERTTAAAWDHLRAIGQREPLRLEPAVERIEALAGLGRLEEAEAEAQDLQARLLRVDKPWARAGLARGLARIALDRDRPEDALRITEPADGEPVGWSRFDLGRVLLVRCEALRRLHHRREALGTVRRAGEVFRVLGATAWEARAAAEAARLATGPSAGLALTPTEDRVAVLAGSGLSTRDVADRLGISPRTVETHLEHIYGKLGVSSRAELGREMAHREDGSGAPARGAPP